jgi:hypothetical protein
MLHGKQVPQVTEEAVLAVISLYPTVLSLTQAYAMLVSPLSLFNLCNVLFIYNATHK